MRHDFFYRESSVKYRKYLDANDFCTLYRHWQCRINKIYRISKKREISTGNGLAHEPNSSCGLFLNCHELRMVLNFNENKEYRDYICPPKAKNIYCSFT
jgi:hypothetical protein